MVHGSMRRCGEFFVMGAEGIIYYRQLKGAIKYYFLQS